MKITSNSSKISKRKWAEENREVLKKHAIKQRETTKRYRVALKKEEDKDLIDWLDSQISSQDMTVQGFLKELLYNQMQNSSMQQYPIDQKN